MFSTFKNESLLKLYITILVFSTIGFMSNAISIPYVLSLGGGVFEVNLMMTIQSSIGILLLVPFGMLSDRLGRRPMLLLSIPLQLVGFIIYAFATNPVQLIIVSILNGFSGMDFMPVLLSMIADITEPEKRQEAFSLFFFMSSIGIFLGPAIGSLFLLIPGTTIRNLYQILAMSQFLFLIYLLVVIKETKTKTGKSEHANYKSAIMGLFRQRRFQSLVIMSFLYFFCNNILLTYIPISSSVNLHLSNAEITSISSFRNLAIMIVRFLLPLILTKIPSKPLLTLALLLGGTISLASVAISNYVSIILVMFVSGLSYGVVFTLTSILIAEYSSSANRGIANSMLSLTMGASSIMKFFTTSIAETMGFNSVFIISGFTALVSTIPLLLLNKKTKSRG